MIELNLHDFDSVQSVGVGLPIQDQLPCIQRFEFVSERFEAGLDVCGPLSRDVGLDALVRPNQRLSRRRCLTPFQFHCRR